MTYNIGDIVTIVNDIVIIPKIGNKIRVTGQIGIVVSCGGFRGSGCYYYAIRLSTGDTLVCRDDELCGAS